VEAKQQLNLNNDVRKAAIIAKIGRYLARARDLAAMKDYHRALDEISRAYVLDVTNKEIERVEKDIRARQEESLRKQKQEVTEHAQALRRLSNEELRIEAQRIQRELEEERRKEEERRSKEEAMKSFPELSQAQEPLQEKHKEKQCPSNLSLLLVRKDGTIAQVPRTSGMVGSSTDKKRNFDDTDILRFRESERLLHWAIAIPFMVCWITGLILMLVYNPDPMRPYRIIFAAIHRVSGVSLIFLPILVMFRKRGDFRVHLYNIKCAWLWSLDDLKWLFLMGIAAINKKIVLPQQGKFNAAEKVNFILVMIGWIVFAVTGVMMVIKQTAWISWIVHVTVAFIVTPTMLGHIYMATVNPETRRGISGMLTGFVNRDWAKHHYARWYYEEFVHSASRNNSEGSSKK